MFDRYRTNSRRFKVESRHVIAVGDSSFQREVIQSNEPVLVDFWATWCGPCRTLAPRIDDLAKKYSGKIKVASVDIDSNPETPSSFGVRSIPTLLLFKGGKVVGELVGAHPTQTIEDLFKQVLA
jgi:thioredoxin 1